MANTEPNNTDWIPEEEIAQQLGIEREKIRAARPHLGPGAVSMMGKVIYWTRTAAAELAQRLGLPASIAEKTPAAPAVKENAPAPEGEELTVFSGPGPGGWHFPNRNLIKAKRPTGEIVVVRVLDSRKYLPKDRFGKPMVMRAKQATSGTWWVLIGREPRFPGIW